MKQLLGPVLGALLLASGCSGKSISNADESGGTGGVGATQGGKGSFASGGDTPTGGTGVTSGGATRGGSSNAKGGGASTGGRASTGGTATTGGTASTAGAASVGGSAGTGGALGVAPIDGKCGPNATKHPDMLCYCQPATLSACADGCSDLQTDADHCGDCNIKCAPTTACRAGRCATMPTSLVVGDFDCGSITLALAGSTLYWTDMLHGTVSSIATTGGTVKPLVNGQLAPTHIEVRGTQMYWLATGSQAVMTATTAGAGAKVIAQGATDIGGFTLSADGKELYYAEGTKILRVDAPSGGTLTAIGYEDSGIPRALALSGNLLVYPTDLNGDVDVMTLVDGALSVCASADSQTAVNKNCGRIARSQGGLYMDALYVIDQQAYWMNDTQIETSPAYQPTGISATVVSAGNPMAIRGTAMAIANQMIYMADDTGYVYEAPLKVDTQATFIARGQCEIDQTDACIASPTSIVADATRVYWAGGDCSIVSVPLQ